MVRLAIRRVEEGEIDEGEARYFRETQISSKGLKLESLWHNSDEISTNN